jgi:hypothetical protein
MEMFIQNNSILRYVAENGRLPNDLGEMGDISVVVQYLPLGGDIFQLSGQAGDITVRFSSNDPIEDLLGDAMEIVSGSLPSTSGQAPAI